ncbi:MAG: hypothetical protein KC731_32225 [Myxococcales bacterium]|nr:hypothetical protein [Myxococcales bacterium]
MSARGWLVVARDELRHQLRSPLQVVFLLLLGLLSLGMSTGTVKVSSGDTSVGGKVAWVTSEVMVAYLFGASLLLYLFFVTIAAGRALLRDEEHGLLPLVAATPLGADGYLAGKLLGTVGAQLVALVVHVSLQIVFNHGLHDPAAHPWIGPFAARAYLMPAVLVLVPTMLAFVALGAGLAATFRRPVAVYLVPVAVLVICGFFVWSYRPSWLPGAVDQALMIGDPFAMRWLQVTLLEADRGVDFYNHARVPWDFTFVANRVALVAIALALLGLARRATGRVFRGAMTQRRSSGRSARVEVVSSDLSTRPLVALGQTSRVPSLLASLRTVTTFELRTLLRRPGILLAPPLLIAQVVGEVWGQEGVFGTEVIATAGWVAVRSAGVLSTVICLMSMFYLVESLHRERALRLDGIYYSAPAEDAAIVGGKVLANTLLGFAIVAVAMVAGALALALRGEAPVELGPFVLVWVLAIGPSLLLWNSFVAAAYTLSGSRNLGYGAGLAALAATIYGSVTNELTYVDNWALWGTLRWSDISVFELDRAALVDNRITALLASAFCLQLAVVGFRRRSRDPLAAAVSRSPRRLVPLALATLAALFVTHREVEAGPDGDRAEDAREDYWRAHHDTWLAAPKPGLAEVDLDLDIEPAERRFAVKGSYTVVNHHDAPLPRFAVTLRETFEDLRFTLDGEPYEVAPRAGLLVVERPLGVGERVTLGFSYRGHHPAGSGKHGMRRKEFVLPSGVIFNSLTPAVLPTIGYERELGVDEDNETEPRHHYPGYHEARLEPYLGSATPFSTRIAITGPADFTFNSVGRLTADETQGDRRRVVWESVAPVRFFNVIGGRYQVKRGEGAAVFYDARHPYNVDVMLEALEGARKHYGEWFGAYPYGELKLSEFPSLATYAEGFPSNITFSEGIGFLAAGELNAAFTITAHEAAHQWWANRLTPGEGPGAPVLAEALSHFSALLLLREMRGDEVRRGFAQVIERRYLEERRRDGERALIEVDGSREGDTTLFYDKGGSVFWMLAEQLGHEPLKKGLAAMIARYGEGPDYPAVPDLLAVLREHAVDGAAFDAMAHQLFAEVVLPEYRVTATTTASGSGHRVDATVDNRGTGAFLVEVAVLGDGDLREVTRVEIPSEGSRSLSLEVPFAPRSVVVDPDVHVLQLGRSAAKARL